MESQYAAPPADALLGIVATPIAAVTPALATAGADDSAASARWLAWRARGAKSNQATARTTNRAFAVLLIALAGWLVFQLLA